MFWSVRRTSTDYKLYPWGDTIGCDDANYGRGIPSAPCRDHCHNGICDNDTHPVGNYAANGYGLFDMAGNVWDWVNDWVGEDYYSVSPLTTRRVPSVARQGVFAEAPFTKKNGRSCAWPSATDTTRTSGPHLSASVVPVVAPTGRSILGTDFWSQVCPIGLLKRADSMHVEPHTQGQ